MRIYGGEEQFGVVALFLVRTIHSHAHTEVINVHALAVRSFKLSVMVLRPRPWRCVFECHAHTPPSVLWNGRTAAGAFAFSEQESSPAAASSATCSRRRDRKSVV